MRRPLAELKPQVYIDPRPAEYFQPFYRHARERRIGPLLELARLVLVPACMVLYRVRCFEADNLPAAGPAIIAPNHFSTLDHFFVAMYLRRRVNFMAKSQLFKGPLAPVLKHVGAFPVRRGQRDLESIETALAILRRGGVVVIYPEGGRSRSTDLAGRAKPGVGLLALASGAPVVPVAIHGSQYARNWKYLQFPRIRVRYGKPVRYVATEGAAFDRALQQAVADDVLDRIQALWRELDGKRAPAAVASLPQAVVAQTRQRIGSIPPRIRAVRPTWGVERLRSAPHPRQALAVPTRRAREAALRSRRLRAGAELARRLERRGRSLLS